MILQHQKFLFISKVFLWSGSNLNEIIIIISVFFFALEKQDNQHIFPGSDYSLTARAAEQNDPGR